jgi:hypothetical protein
MNTVDLASTPVSLDEALAMAEKGNLVLPTSAGREFVLAELADLAHEAELLAGQ